MGGKSVVVLRHAKAVSREPGIEDRGRTLSGKGVRQAKHLARILKAADEQLDVILASSAPRALETALTVADALGLRDSVEQDWSYYGCSPEHWVERLSMLPDETSSVMIVGHNPELEMFTLQIGDRSDVALPTCGAVKCTGLEKWSMIGHRKMQTAIVFSPSETMDDEIPQSALADLWR